MSTTAMREESGDQATTSPPRCVIVSTPRRAGRTPASLLGNRGTSSWVEDAFSAEGTSRTGSSARSSRSTTQIPLQEKRIFEPSGDHATVSTQVRMMSGVLPEGHHERHPSMVVTRWASVPSTATVYSASPAPSRLANARRWPSGDQDHAPLTASDSRTDFPPLSTEIRWSANLPPESLTPATATQRPSGDHAGGSVATASSPPHSGCLPVPSDCMTCRREDRSTETTSELLLI